MTPERSLTLALRSMLLAAALLASAATQAQAPPSSDTAASAPATPTTITSTATSSTAAPATMPAIVPPANFVAPPLPANDDTNAERARSQPGNNAPFWRQVRDSGERAGYTSLPGAEMGVLVQEFVQYPGSRRTTAGEAWREVRNRWIVPYGGALFLIALLAVAIFYFVRGPVGHPMREGDRRIERFTPFERAAHWTNAIAFVVLAVSGLVMAFGRVVLLPLLGGAFFGNLTHLLKTLHNFVGPLFVVSLLVVIFTFVKDEFPQKGDWHWLKHGGGMLRGDKELPSHRFNAGEKIVFWASAVLFGLLAAGSGVVLDGLLPALGDTRGEMQVAHMIHATAAMFMIALLVGHIYLGTLGVRGAYTAMRHGWVDEHWAREHHSIWAEQIRRGEIPAQRSKQPPPAEDRLTGRPA